MRDVFNEMEKMQYMLERAFNEGYGQTHVAPTKQCMPARSALADMNQTDTAVKANFEMPGVNKKDIKINVTDKAIEVKAYKSDIKDIKTNDKETKSCKSIKFYRRLALPARVNPDMVTAKYENGILRVEMPKAEIAKRKEIAIE
jgi:HSP20 family protein|tara:strand:+ start:370 stop:801 length:432 start_codon:yes stop_codon:yes gene_type:complete